MREQIKRISPDFLKRLYRKLRYLLISAEFKLFSNFPIERKRVVFCNVWGYGDNPKWIARALRARDKSTEIIFITDTSKLKHSARGIKFVETNSVAAIYYLATAHVWVDCNRKEPYIRKRTGQFYIQTWHGSLPLKKIENDYAAKLGEKYMQNAKRDSEMADLFLSNSDFCSDIYRKAFLYKGRIEITGSARLDPILRPDSGRVNRLRSAITLNIENSTGSTFKEYRKIAVYAPTFRDGGSAFKAAEGLDFSKIAETLEKRFGGKFAIIVKMHPLDAGLVMPVFTENVLDGSRFGDLYELLEAADVLITDYSNTLFEFAYTGNPVFLYAPDSREYARERGFYFDYDSLPYPHAVTEAQLLKTIEEYDSKKYLGRQQEFFRNLGIREDGRASVRIADMIIKIIYGRK